MEQRAPRVASAGKISGTLLITAAIINLNVDFLGSSGITIEELSALSLSIVCYIVAYIASRERQVVELNSNLSLEQQLYLLETTPTKAGNTKSATSYQSSQTKSIIDSIIGSQDVVDEGTIGQAITTLSLGNFGEAAQSIAAASPAPHSNAAVVMAVSKLSKAESNVPLPDEQREINKEQDNIISVKPRQDYPAQQSDTSLGLSLPDLSDLFTGDSKIEAHNSTDRTESDNYETPELPDLDDLF